MQSESRLSLEILFCKVFSRPSYSKARCEIIQVIYKVQLLYDSSLALWRHYVNLLLQSFRSVSYIRSSSVLINNEDHYHQWIISTDEDPQAYGSKALQSYIYVVFHKARLVLYSPWPWTNIERTYNHMIHFNLMSCTLTFIFAVHGPCISFSPILLDT